MPTQDLINLRFESATPAEVRYELPHKLGDFVLELEASEAGSLITFGGAVIEFGGQQVKVTAAGVAHVFPRRESSIISIARCGLQLHIFGDGFGVAPLELPALDDANAIALNAEAASGVSRLRVADGAPVLSSDLFTFVVATRAQVLFDEEIDSEDATLEGQSEVLEYECKDLRTNVIVESVVVVHPTRGAPFNLINIGDLGALEFRDAELHLRLNTGDTAASADVAWTADSIPPYQPGREFTLALHLTLSSGLQKIDLYVGGMLCGSVQTHANSLPVTTDKSNLISFGGPVADSASDEFAAAFTRVRALVYTLAVRDELYGLQPIFHVQELLNESVTAGRAVTPETGQRGLNAPLLAEVMFDAGLLETPGTELLSFGAGVIVRAAGDNMLELELRAAEGAEVAGEKQMFALPDRQAQAPVVLSVYSIRNHVLTIRLAINGAELASVQTNQPIGYTDEKVHFAAGSSSGLRAIALSCDGNQTSGLLA